MSSELVDPLASVRAYLAAEKSENTRRAYATDWVDFQAFCEARGEPFLQASPIVVAQYLAHLADAGRKTATIERRVAAIRYAHKAAGFEPPTGAEGVKAVMRGVRRRLGRRQVRKAPATANLLSDAINRLPESLQGLRDRALLLVGFAAALRRSELVALNVVDVTARPRGLILHIRQSKTDQVGAGADIPVPNGKLLKPGAALRAWLEAAGISDGPIFREVDRHGRVGSAALSDRSVARIVKRAFAAIGANVEDFSGHSLRAGFVTTSLDHGVDVFRIMFITRHAKVDTLKTYDRRENGFDDHAGDEFL
jgi:site-specific recombinase XerD